MSARLCARGLTLIRGDRCLFSGLDFDLPPGELLLIEGPNGSGKTSLLRAIVGLIELEEGSVTWNGLSTRTERQAFHTDLVWMGHRPGFKAELSLLENLRFESGLRAMAPGPVDDVLERLSLSELRRLPYRVLSAGQQRRAALARLMLSAAPFWLLDEPYTNLDSAGQTLVAEVLDEHLKAGRLAAVASHQAVSLSSPVQRIRLT